VNKSSLVLLIYFLLTIFEDHHFDYYP